MEPNPISLRVEYLIEKVIVNIPLQSNPIQVQQLPLAKLESMPVVPGGFTPFRLLISFKFIGIEQPETEITRFDPPIEVRLRFDAKDLESARELGKPLSLGFWNGKEWIRCTREKHQFYLEPDQSPDTGGWGIVYLSHWDDPTKAWGT